MNSQTGHLGDKSVRTVKLEKNIEIPSLTPTITNYSTTQLGSASSVDSGKIRESMLVLIFGSGQGRRHLKALSARESTAVLSVSASSMVLTNS